MPDIHERPRQAPASRMMRANKRDTRRAKLAEPAALARILIVEDESIVALDLEDTLESFGYKVTGRAMSGESAIECAKLQKPDLVLMDIRLGGRIDGVDAAETIGREVGCPIIYLTATADDRTLLRAKKTTPYGYLIKPFKSLELRCAVEMALHKHAVECRLREQERWFSTTLRALGDGVAITDPDGFITFLNPVAEALTGWASDDAVGKPVEEILRLRHSDSRQPVVNPIYHALMDGTTHTLEDDIVLVARSGATLSIGDTATRIVDDRGKVLGGVIVFRDITGQRSAQERVRYLAEHDPLTGLPNRMLFRDRVSQSITQARRNRQGVGILFVDLDRFKHINDSLGHEAGDRLLTLVAERLKACLREGDTVARLGGDEFVVNLPGLNGAMAAESIARKILDTLGQAFMVNDHELHVSASVGISLYPIDGSNTEELMRAADSAMYHAKEHGRDQYQFYTAQLNEGAHRRLMIAPSLHRALQRNEFSLEYQPVVELQSGGIVAAEVLLRWNNPELGLIPTGEFIKVAEDVGLIAQIGEWVLRRACRQAQQWRQAGFPEMRVAVNVSPHQIRRTAFPDLVAAVLEEAGLTPDALVLEITEGVLMTERTENILILEQLSRMGVGLAVDDFGTGYSSLAYIQRFPIDYLKIDQSFLHGLGNVVRDTALVTAIIAMAHGLRLKVIAEGVETAAQAAFLRSHNCLAGQGYHFGRPVPPQAFSKLMGTRGPAVQR
jgi:diguanylate cyclase (GGDEF)-like protein/PAS domain S-box-containing protein